MHEHTLTQMQTGYPMPHPSYYPQEMAAGTDEEDDEDIECPADEPSNDPRHLQLWKQVTLKARCVCVSVQHVQARLCERCEGKHG